MSQLKTTSLSHKDNNGTPNITLFPDGTTSLSGVGGKVVGYQQGVWTPELDTSDLNLQATHNTQDGFWTRCGNLVTIHFYASLNSLTSGGNGNAAVGSLPYSFVDGANFHMCITTSANMNPHPSAARSGFSSQQFIFRSDYNQNSFGAVGANAFTAGSSAGGFASYLTDDTTWTPINGATVT